MSSPIVFPLFLTSTALLAIKLDPHDDLGSDEMKPAVKHIEKCSRKGSSHCSRYNDSLLSTSKMMLTMMRERLLLGVSTTVIKELSAQLPP